jgi:hypothetical protein
MPGQGTHNASPTGRSAQAPAASPNGTKQPTSQGQQVEPNAKPPKGQQRTNQAQQEQPSTQQPSGQQRLNRQAQTPSTSGEMNNAPLNAGGSDQRPAAAGSTDRGNRSSAAGGLGQVQVTEQQRTQIHERIAHLRTQRLNRADFSLEVGVRGAAERAALHAAARDSRSPKRSPGIRHLDTSSVIGITPMAWSSHGGSQRWVSGTDPSRPAHRGRTAMSNASSARSGVSASITVCHEHTNEEGGMELCKR